MPSSNEHYAACPFIAIALIARLPYLFRARPQSRPNRRVTGYLQLKRLGGDTHQPEHDVDAARRRHGWKYLICFHRGYSADHPNSAPGDHRAQPCSITAKASRFSVSLTVWGRLDPYVSCQPRLPRRSRNTQEPPSSFGAFIASGKSLDGQKSGTRI